MMRLLGLCLLLYAPHLVEEYATRMYDDPIIVFAFGPFASMPPRQATYLVFQIMMVVALGMAYFFGLGGRWRGGVMGGLGLALLGESHHLVRFLASREYNSGLVTSVPMPVLGVMIWLAIARRPRPAIFSEPPP